MPLMVLIALATLVSEDLTCIAAGFLAAQGRLGFLAGALACFAGIVIGDLLLFLAGRFAGRSALAWPLLRKLVPADKLAQASAWLSARGAPVVFLSRFAPGLRLPTYFAAGLLGTDFRRFALYFVLAAAAWTPLLTGIAAVLGGQAARTALSAAGGAFPAIVVTVLLWIVLRRLLRALFGFRVRRRLAGFLARKFRWEFWPPWAAYAPLVPYLAWLALKHRSPTLFTAANPGMLSGGFVGESKSRILEYLDRTAGAVAAWVLIPASASPAARVQSARCFMQARGLDFPVALKPDVGERGAGVAIVRTPDELESYLLTAGDTIVQEYVEGPEFGVFYYRHPEEPTGRIFSITGKRFPEVFGDGRSTLEELILRDPRAFCLASMYLRRIRRMPSSVPPAGEAVPLVDIGSHCRGAVFLDGGGLRTPALQAAVDKIAKGHPGFFFGRFDVRAPSVEAFQSGLFRVIELNGVSAEATHIYDPAVTLLEAYRVLFAQWRIAFDIGAANRRAGVEPMPAPELLRLVWKRVFRAEPAAAPDVPAVHAQRA